jgi:hypothetical protein
MLEGFNFKQCKIDQNATIELLPATYPQKKLKDIEGGAVNHFIENKGKLQTSTMLLLLLTLSSFSLLHQDHPA